MYKREISFFSFSQLHLKVIFKNMFKKVNVKEKLISFPGGATTETEPVSGEL